MLRSSLTGTVMDRRVALRFLTAHTQCQNQRTSNRRSRDGGGQGETKGFTDDFTLAGQVRSGSCPRPSILGGLC